MDSRGSSWNATVFVACTSAFDDTPLTRLGGEGPDDTTTTQDVRRRSRAEAARGNFYRPARIQFANALAAHQKES